MPVDDADTGMTSGGSQLDGKPLSGVNIFAPEELEKRGLTLDPPDDDGDDDEIDDEYIDPEEEDVEDEPEDQEEAPLEDDGDRKLLEKYKTPEALAKALRHAQRKLSEQGNELGERRSREGALLELVKRAGVDKEAGIKTEDVDDGVPKDEYGIPRPAEGYWKDVYLPQLKEYYLNQFVKEGYEESEARLLAATEATEHMLEERLRWRESYEAKRSEAITQARQREEEEVQENSIKQEEAIFQEKEKIVSICARMGIDSEGSFAKVMEVSGQMVKRAMETGQLTRLQASRPETAVQAIWGAWAYLQKEGILTEAAPEKPKPVHAAAQSSRQPGAPPRPVVAKAEAATQGNYSKAHVDFAKGLGITPDELEKKYGRL